MLLTTEVEKPLSHSAFATIPAAAAGENPLEIHQSNILFAVELDVLSVYPPPPVFVEVGVVATVAGSLASTGVSVVVV